MRRRRFLAIALAAMAGLAALRLRQGFGQAMVSARRALEHPRQRTPTRFGMIEWAEAGSGPAIIMLHGTGGGYDQGLAFCHRLSRAGWRVIAPSRFGYLRSDFPDGLSPAIEADGLADLMAALGLETAVVMGGSAGAIPAIEFAIRHPARTRALVAIVPAAFAPGRPPVRPGAVGKAVMELGLRSDFLFWLGARWNEDLMIRTLLATDPALVHAAAPEEQARIRAILYGLLPITARARGLEYDARTAGNPPQQACEQITAPTLAISLEDDLFQTLAAARHLVGNVPGARLISYPSGGHVWVGRDRALWAEVDGFLRTLPGQAG